jgi:hypothetical protein
MENSFWDGGGCVLSQFMEGQRTTRLFIRDSGTP